MLSYSLRDLLRNPRRTLASVAGVALAVGLFFSVALFVDGSAATMTRRAIAPVTIDMQAGLTAPLASPLSLTETITGPASLAVGQTVSVTLVAANTGTLTANGLVLKDELPVELVYVPGTTTLNGRRVADGGGESPALAGLELGALSPHGTASAGYVARAAAPVASVAALALRGTVASLEDPAPVAANAPAPPSLADLRSQVARLAGVSSADELGALDLPGAALRAGGAALSQPVRVFAFDPGYLGRFPMVQLTAGSYAPGSALLSPDAARSLGVGPGGGVSLSVPGRAQPIALPVGGIADFSHADPLFASRSAGSQGEFVQVPDVVVVGSAVFRDVVLPALRADAASPNPVLKSPPTLELDVLLDRARLDSDPTAAVVATRGLRRSIERTAPGQVAVIDNVSDALDAARGDVVLAKVLFLFLGLPGVLLAAYLSRYAAGLLSRAQRREQATLRARGAQPRHLLRALACSALAVALLGSTIGLALGALSLVAVLGPGALAGASPQAVLLSAALAAAAGVLTTALALYLPGRLALGRETTEERRELEVAATSPAWMRLRLDLVFLAAAAVVGLVTYLAGGFRPTPVEGQSVSLAFYVLLAPLLGWVGATLLAVRALLGLAGRVPTPRAGAFGTLVRGTLRHSLRRRPQALASATVALSLAVAFGTSLSIFVATYQAEKQVDARFVIGSDVRVTPSALSPQAASFASRLLVPGVSDASPVAQTQNAQVGTDKRALVAIDPTTFPRVATMPDSFFVGTTAGSAMTALRSDPSAVLVSTELAATFDVQPGDPVKIQLTDRGPRQVPVTFHAAGLFKSFPGFPQGVDLVANLAYYQSATGSPAVDLFLLRTADASEPAVTEVSRLLRNGPGRTTPLLVETTATAYNKDQSTLAALNLRGLGGLESLYTVLMSTAGVAIFVFGLLLQRRKEYVTMRALGIRMRQLQALVLGEAGLVTVPSLAVGALVGTGMAYLFVQVLSPLFTIPPTGLTVPASQLAVLGSLVLCGMGLSVLAGGGILRRLDPVELLREE